MNRTDPEHQRSEVLTARIYGKKVPASGAGSWEKLDIQGLGKFSRFRIENKYSEKSISITPDKLQKAKRQALGMGKDYFFVLEFPEKKRYVLLEETTFLGLVDSIEEDI